MSKDITDADLLDAERQNIAKERAASSAHKDFTPHFEFLVGDTFSVTDAATADDDTEAMADTFQASDEPAPIADVMPLASGFKVTNNYGWVEHNNHKLKIDFQDGKNAIDVTERGNNGVITGATIVDGPLPFSDYALSFDGIDDKLVVLHKTDLEITGAITIIGWVKYTGNHRDSFLTKGFDGTYGFGAENLATSRLIFGKPISQEANRVYSDGTLVAGRYYCIAVTYDGATTVKFYIDGNLDSTKTITVGSTTAGRDIMIGANSFGSYDHAVIPDVNVFNRVLNADEIKAVMARGQLEQPLIPDFCEMEVII